MARGEKFYEELVEELQWDEEVIFWADASWLKSGKMTEAESGIIAITSRRFVWRGKQPLTVYKSTFDIPLEQIRGLMSQTRMLGERLVLDVVGGEREFLSREVPAIIDAYNRTLKTIQSSSVKESSIQRGGSSESMADEIEKLGALLEKGLITEQEFKDAKKNLMGL